MYGLGYPTMPGMSAPTSNLPSFNIGDRVRVKPYDYVGRVIDRSSEGDQGPYKYMIEIGNMGDGIKPEWYPHGMLSIVKDKQ